MSDYYRDIVKDELNVKDAVFTEDISALSSYSFKPQLKTVGPKYGKVLGQIRQYLSQLDGNRAMEELEQTGVLRFAAGDTEVELSREDLLIDVQQKEGYHSVADGGITVALCTVLTDALVEEGFVRELISKVQTMRKDADFDVTDHIAVQITGSEKIQKILSENADTFQGAVLCDALSFAGADKAPEAVKEWNINGEKATISLCRLH